MSQAGLQFPSLMHVYIDESGVFNPGPNPKASCLAAVLIPSGNKAKVFRNFARLSESWPHEDGEIKGKLLEETHLVQLVELLCRNDALVEISAFDSALQTRDELEAIQKSVSSRIANVPGWAIPKLRPPRRIFQLWSFTDFGQPEGLQESSRGLSAQRDTPGSSVRFF